MRAIWAMAIKDLRLLARDRAAFFLTFAWPLMLAVFFGAFGPFGGREASTSMVVLVVDDDASAASLALREQVDADARIELREAELDAATQALARGEVPAILHVPRGHAARASERAIEVVVDPRRRSEASVLLDVLALAGHRSAGGPEPLAIVRREVEASASLGGNLAAARPPSPYAVTFPQGIVWAVIACAATFAVSLVAERTRGTLLRLLVAPLRPLEILAGKALACALAITSMEIVLVGLGLAFGVVPQSFALLALALASTMAGFVGIMMLLAALGRRTHSAAGLAWMVMMMLALLGGGMLPLFLMPSWMQTLAAASPVAWALLAIEGATWRGLGLVELALPCAGLIALGFGSALVGARLVRSP